jgi:hypothetical protein
MSKPAKTPAAPLAPVKTLTREQIMNQRAAADFAAMDKVNQDRSIEYAIMNAPSLNPLEPQPSERNSASQAPFSNADLTFSRVGGDFANSAYMRSRRPPGGG